MDREWQTFHWKEQRFVLPEPPWPLPRSDERSYSESSGAYRPGSVADGLEGGEAQGRLCSISSDVLRKSAFSALLQQRRFLQDREGPTGPRYFPKRWWLSLYLTVAEISMRTNTLSELFRLHAFCCSPLCGTVCRSLICCCGPIEAAGVVRYCAEPPLSWFHCSSDRSVFGNKEPSEILARNDHKSHFVPTNAFCEHFDVEKCGSHTSVLFPRIKFPIKDQMKI